jgi:hypothetical protein
MLKRRFCENSNSVKLDPKISSEWPRHTSRRPSVSRRFESSRLHPSGHHGNTSGRSSEFDKESNFLHKHIYGKTAASVRTTWQHRSDVTLIRQDVEKNCNLPDDRATPSGCGPDMELRGACYGKSIAQLSVRTTLVYFQMPLKENRISVDLGLL